jgi:hypothetical protein
LLAIEERLFTEWRVAFYGSGIAVAWALLSGWLLVRGRWLLGPDGMLSSLDFCWIWASSKITALGDPFGVYDPATYAAAQDIYYRPGECQFVHLYDYPPTFQLFTYPLGLMPYMTAFAVWVFFTLLFYAAAIWAVLPRPAAAIAAITPVPVLLNALDGQNGFLTAGLMGLSLLFVERQPGLSGIFLGLLTYKPQFGVLFPLALLASRNWRALASAAATSLIVGAAAGYAFGYREWPGFVASLFGRDPWLSVQAGVEPRLESFYGLVVWAGASLPIAWVVQVAVAVVVAATVVMIWAMPNPHALRAAVLSVGSVIVTPYVMKYDLCILSVAAAFLVKDGLSRGFSPGERFAILGCFVLAFLLLAQLPPTAPFVCLILLVLAIRRIPARRMQPVGARPHAQPRLP